jgi:hypothetical protein
MAEWSSVFFLFYFLLLSSSFFFYYFFLCNFYYFFFSRLRSPMAELRRGLRFRLRFASPRQGASHLRQDYPSSFHYAEVNGEAGDFSPFFPPISSRFPHFSPFFPRNYTDITRNYPDTSRNYPDTSRNYTDFTLAFWTNRGF